VTGHRGPHPEYRTSAPNTVAFVPTPIHQEDVVTASGNF
jgi:hypothetical protein